MEMLQSSNLFLLGLDRVAVLVYQSLGAHHLQGVVERVQLGLGSTVRAKVAVGPGEVLAVVDGEVHVVKSVVRGAVEELLRPVARDHVTVVNENCPNLDSDEKDKVEISLHGAEKDESAIE